MKKQNLTNLHGQIKTGKIKKAIRTKRNLKKNA